MESNNKRILLAPGIFLAGFLAAGSVFARSATGQAVPDRQRSVSPASAIGSPVPRGEKGVAKLSVGARAAKAPKPAPGPAASDPGRPKTDLAAEVQSYRIGPEDELQISVWREPELSMPVVVRPDGVITLPLLNDVPVAGLTPRELQTSLTGKFKAFLNDPQVTVIVRAIRSRRVYLMGQVARPGAYQLVAPKTVLQLLAEAGGLTAFAKADSIYVLRNLNGRQERIQFRYKHVLRSQNSAADLELAPGDIVVVP